MSVRTTDPSAPHGSATDSGTTVPLRERISFGLGDLASNLTWTTITSYLLFFYTDVALISAAAAGTLLLVGRLLDAVFDPLVGIVLDRTNTRFGRARPYLIFGAPVLAVLTVLTFFTPSAEGARIGWAYVTFILVGLAYSAVNIPYGALMPMMTRDSATRVTLGSFRFAFAAVGLVIVSVATTPLVAAFGGGDQRRGFLLTAVLFAAIGCVVFWITARGTKERVPVVPLAQQKHALRTSLKTLATNGPWLIVILFSVLLFARLGVITGGAVYFAIHVLGSAGAVAVVLLAFSLSALSGALITPWMLKRFGHRRALIIGNVIGIALSLLQIPFRHDLVVFTLVFFLAATIGGMGFVAVPALISDTIEYQEYKSDIRNEGLLYAGYSFATKVGTAIGGAVLAWGLAAIGYTASSKAGSLDTGISWIYIGIPILLMVLQTVVIAFYKLQRELPRITASIATRRSGTGS
ncbi:MFS transporter [Curtobacterium pusillum]|uniref:MFS transporter n=1 Tax=Curtobacterium pusillum TaxID=69373 RepID=A0ABX2MA69_9MICO|nr:MFS transporter [Curtobacterium pusillum]NUU12667.1 MFS transporter [Curtobacterium pusillum]GLK33067.1 MFS transporter [Curtobacterium pusillum]